MFPYWNAPPSLLRAWASPDDPDRALDDKLHFSSLAVLAGEKLGSLLGQIRCYLRAVSTFRVVDSQPSGC
jgi:hypothetical protein